MRSPRYLREDNANVGAPYDTSMRTVELVERAHLTAGRFLSCHPDEVAFGQSMTSLNFLLTRALGRTLERGDEIVCTRLDHDANVAPWLELAEDLGVVVRFAGVHDDLSLDLDDLEAQLSERTKVVAFPIASNAVGTTPDVARVVELAHGAGALAWADAVHYGPHGPIDIVGWDLDVLLCSPYKFFGPHMGMAFGRRELLESLRPVQGAPRAERAGRPPLRARHAAARAPRRLRGRGRVHRLARLGGDRGARAAARRAVPRRAPAGGRALRAARRWRARPDVRVQSRRAARPRRSPTSSRRARSPSGTATTTRSRS